MSEMTLEERLRKAVENTEIGKVISSSSNLDGEKEPEIKKVAVQLRVSKDDVPDWLSIIDFILQEEEEQDPEGDKWSAHCCKTFVRHEGKFGFVWNIAISSREDLKRPIADVCRAIRTLSMTMKSSTDTFYQPKQGLVRRAANAVHKSSVVGRDPVISRVGDRVEVEEMPLAGVTEGRNRPKGPGGKGAHYISGG